MAEGMINVHCDSSAIIKSLKLKFFKKVLFNLKKLDGSLPEIETDSAKTHEDQFYSICENTELKPGCNTFPFSFMVQSEEKSTGIAKSYFIDSVCVLEKSFLVEGICETPEGIFKSEKHISIINFSKEKQFIDTKIRTSSYLCLFKKTTNYRIQTDKQWYSRGDNINISLSSLNRMDNAIVSSAYVNIYQVVLLHDSTINTMKSKLITSFSAMPLCKNTFEFQFRIPMALNPSISDQDFTVESVLIFHLNLYNGQQIKIRKSLFIGEAFFEISSPQINMNTENYVYVTRHLESRSFKKLSQI